MKNITNAAIRRLSDLATHATQGKWEVDEDGEVIALQLRGRKRYRKEHVTVTIPSEGGGICRKEDAEYIAYANPERIKQLLEYVWHLEGMLEDQE
jgi:hypothetical protein